MKSVAKRSMIRSLLSDAGGCFEALEPRSMLSVGLTNPLADVQVRMNASMTTVELAGRFSDPNLTGTFVKFESVFGNIDVQLFDVQTPRTVENFLRYVDGNLYDNSMIHRSIPGFVVQGGGFRATVPSPPSISSFPPVLNEPGISNTRGTIAMAKLGGNPNSATNQWFFNLANNSANLDGQNGGFTVFGRVLGNGMSVVDAIAAVPTFDADNGGVFSDVPLRNYTSGTVTNDNLVAFSEIGRTSPLTYTVTVGNPNLISAQVVGGQLRVSYLPNQTGTTTVTVRATGIDSSTNFAEDSFVVTVNPPFPELASVNAESTVVRIGEDIILTASGAIATNVQYWLDVNDDENIDVSDILLGTSTNSQTSFRLQIPASTIGLDSGARILARAGNSVGELSSPRSVTIQITDIPRPALDAINAATALIGAPTPTISASGELVLTATGVVGTSVSFWFDVNNNQAIDAGDTQLGSSSDSASDFELRRNASTIGANPAARILARSTNVFGEFSPTRQVTVDIVATPTLGAVNVAAPRSRVSENITLTASSVVGTAVRYWFDSNNNGTVEESDTLLGFSSNRSDSFRLQVSAATIGVNPTARIIARSENLLGDLSTSRAVTVDVVGAPQLAEVAVASARVRLSQNVVLTASGVVGSQVVYWFDANNNEMIDSSDRRLGSSANAADSYRVQVSGRTIGLNSSARIIARAENSLGDLSQTRSVNVDIVTSPTSTGLLVAPASVARGTSVTLQPRSLVDPSNTLAAVLYYEDSNQNNIFDASIDALIQRSTSAPFTAVIPTADKAAGTYRYFMRLEEIDGALSAPATGTFRVTETAPTLVGIRSTSPVVSSIAGSEGNAIYLIPTALPTDRDGYVARIEYYFDEPASTTDTLIDTVITPTPGRPINVTDWQLNISDWIAERGPGTYTFVARAFDNFDKPSTANARTTIRVNAAPRIDGTFTVTPAAPATGSFVTRPGSITFTVTGVTDDVPNVGVRTVEIRADRDGNPDDYEVFIGNARRSGSTWTLTIPTRNFPLGTNRFQAFAIDNFVGLKDGIRINGERSNAVEADIDIENAAPTLAAISVRPTLIINRGDTITLTALSARDVDGTIQRVEYFIDTNGNSEIDAEDHQIGASVGAASLILTSGDWETRELEFYLVDRGSDSLAPRVNKILGRAVDNNEASSIVRSFNLLLNAAPEYIGTTSVEGAPVANTRSTITIESSDIFDIDGGISSVEYVLRYLDQNEIQRDVTIGRGIYNATTESYRFTGSITRPASNNTIWIKITDRNRGVTFVSTNVDLIIE